VVVKKKSLTGDVEHSLLVKAGWSLYHLTVMSLITDHKNIL